MRKPFVLKIRSTGIKMEYESFEKLARDVNGKLKEKFG